MKNKTLIASSAVILLGTLFLVSGISTMAYAQETSSATTVYASTTLPYPPYPTMHSTEGTSSTAEGYAMPMIPTVIGPGHSVTTTPGEGYPPNMPMPSVPVTSTQQGISINGQGQVQLNNGQVQSINGNTLTVSVFGINFTVDTTNAKISAGVVLPNISSYLSNPSSTVPNTQPTVQTTINSGDKVSVSGTVNSTTGVISATTVRDLTAQSQSSTTIQDRINQLLQLINQLKAQYNL